jgi:hypothetical protein
MVTALSFFGVDQFLNKHFYPVNVEDTLTQEDVWRRDSSAHKQAQLSADATSKDSK